MQRLEAGDTGGVIVWDLARFSRRPIEGERFIATAERCRGALPADRAGGDLPADGSVVRVATTGPAAVGGVSVLGHGGLRWVRTWPDRAATVERDSMAGR
jgi:hypothetical protein